MMTLTSARYEDITFVLRLRICISDDNILLLYYNLSAGFDRLKLFYIFNLIFHKELLQFLESVKKNVKMSYHNDITLDITPVKGTCQCRAGSVWGRE